MKKHGFTLAEVIVTLGVVGVIAALTLPIVSNSAAKSQVGPKLAKAVSVWEQANIVMLEDEDVIAITEGFKTTTGTGSSATTTLNFTEYKTALSEHIKMIDTSTSNSSSTNSIFSVDINGNWVSLFNNENQSFETTNGIRYAYTVDNISSDDNLETPPHKQRIGYLAIDIDSDSDSKNIVGKDIFCFALYNDGSLRAIGSENWNEGETSKLYTASEGGCPNSTSSNYNAYCTGSIVENGYKVMYKY